MNDLLANRLVILVLCLACFAQAQKLSIAAASNVGPAFKDVIAGFEKQSGVKVDLTTGASGSLFDQIQKGTPYDLFFSSDREYPKRLQGAGLADTLIPYAYGGLVLWVRNESKLDLTRGIDVLLDPAVRKIAIADPVHAPYGQAAMSALKHFGLADKVKAKLLVGGNTEQTTQLIQSGRGDIGITAMSFAVSLALKGEGRFVEIPQDAYPRMEQTAVILKSSKQQASAKAFLAYLKTPAAIAVMQRYGFHSDKK